MAGRTDGLIKNFRAVAPILAHRLVKFAAADTEVITAAGATDATIGVSIELDAAAGQRVDVAMSDITDVCYGGPITRGDPLTSDAQGRAILAVAGANVRIAGFAMASGVLDDIGAIHLAPGFRDG